MRTNVHIDIKISIIRNMLTQTPRRALERC